MVAAAQDPVVKPEPGAVQDPVVKPRPGTGDRLAAPASVSAVQESDGRIRVTWSSVKNATSYTIVRSVPPSAVEPAKTVTDTVYIDSDVLVGRTYYYLVAGMNDEASGLRAGSRPVTARRSASPLGDLNPPTNVVARYDPSKDDVSLSWTSPGGAAAAFWVDRIIVNSGVQALGRVDTTYIPSAGRALPQGAQVRFAVFTLDATGRRSPLTFSNTVLIDSPALRSSLATVTVSVGTALSLRVRATASAATSVLRAPGSRWVSLDETIATVDATGTVTGRAAGQAQIVAIGRNSDGSLRVSVVNITVIP